MIRDRKDAGAALLSILLIVATLSVAALIATEAIARQTELHKLGARKSVAIWAARSAEAVAISGAADLLEASRLPADSTSNARKAELALPVDGGSVALIVREQAPCFNLNSLGSPDPAVQQRAADGLRVLLAELGLPAHDAARAVDVLGDWIDADSNIRPLGAEDAAYLAPPNASRPGNQLLSGLDELAAIPEFTEPLRAAMAPFTCALPQTEIAAINVNAMTPMSAPVLHAVSRGALSAADARRFIDARPSSGWSDVRAARESIAGRTHIEVALEGVPLAVRGQYFRGEGTAVLDAGSWKFRFMMRAGTGSAPEIVWREFGGAG